MLGMDFPSVDLFDNDLNAVWLLKHVSGYVAMCEFDISLKRITPVFISALASSQARTKSGHEPN